VQKQQMPLLQPLDPTIDQTNNLLALDTRTPTITPFETKNSSKNVFFFLPIFNRNSALFS
jgi:hypothetical protein